MTEEKPELHPVVDLFLRRAESHPEEIYSDKWGWVLAEINKNGSPQERAAVEPIVKKIKLDNAHKNFMRELLNPEPEQGDLFKAGANQSLTQQPIQLEYEMRKIQQEYENQLQQNLWKKLGQP